MLIAHAFKPEMCPALREAFYDFLAQVTIDSKDLGPVKIKPFYGQRKFVDEVFAGLEDDIHHFVFLKARQLGVSTVSLLLDLFWISYFPGLQGALVTDTDPNKDKFRVLIQRMLESLPKSHAIPVLYNNKNGLVLQNGSTLDYIVAGKRKNSGLGRSRAYNFVHATECSSWGDQEGLESLQKSLSDQYPARLYVFESTAQGYNIFWNMWEDAKADTLMKRAIFIGWWAKESYSFDPRKGIKQAELFNKYGKNPPTQEEAELISTVKEWYDFEVSMEQLAWYRHEKDPSGEPTLELDETGSILEQEMPWHEEQAFMLTGASFFSSADINHAVKSALNKPYKGFRYFVGEEFNAIALEQVRSAKLAQLRVWEEPDPAGVYVIGADPAYGSGDSADRFCAQVFRAYADGLDQVAEFVTPNIKTYQFAWIIAHLAGTYSNARLLLELNGPGEAVLVEFRNLASMLNNGMIRNPEGEDGNNLKNVLKNVKTYMYSRQDVFSGSVAPHWRTTPQNKAVVLNQFRDTFTLGQMELRSVDLLEEMRKMVQNGFEIKGEGNAKDDRVIATALVVRAWMDGERKRLQQQGRTREVELAQVSITHDVLTKVFTSNVISDFMARQANLRKAQAASAARGTRWRW
jgi:hypothetical protein